MPDPAHSAAAPGTTRLQALLADLQAGLLERDTAARLLLLATLAREHVLLIGPPGTAKSELARRLHRAFEGAPYFERLLTRFSTPEELFGPLSLKALEDDRYERLVQGFLPTAGLAFLDEVFKANSAILNALLTLLNEREFDNGSGRVRTPLVSVLAASNEVPVDEALRAFYDRFLLRVPVEPVSDEGFAALLALPQAPQAGTAAPLTAGEHGALLRAASDVDLGEDVLQACTALRGWLAQQGQGLSDRRWRQWVQLLRVAAASDGRSAADTQDLWLAPYVASPAPEWVPRIAAWFEAEVLGAVPQDAPWLTRAVEAFEKQLQIEQSAEPEESEGDGGGAGKLAVARALRDPAGHGDDEGDDGGMLRIVSRRLEEQLRRRFSSVHIAARVAQLDELLQRVQAEQAAVAGEWQRLAAQTAGRLWLPPALAQRWLDAHAHTLGVLQALLQRLQATRDGFAALPLLPSLPSSPSAQETPALVSKAAATTERPPAPVLLPPGGSALLTPATEAALHAP